MTVAGRPVAARGTHEVLLIVRQLDCSKTLHLSEIVMMDFSA